MKGRWSLAVKECMGNDVKGFLAAAEEVGDWVDAPQGRCPNPAQYGGGRVRGHMQDLAYSNVEQVQGDDSVFLMALALRNKQQGQSPMEVRKAIQESIFPETRLPFVYRSQHAALDTAARLTAPIEAKPDTLIHADSQYELTPPLHPLVNGPSVVPEDVLSAKMDLEKRRNSLARMKFEIFNNRIQARFMNRHFQSTGFNDVAKGIFKYYNDGDDLIYTHDKPLFIQNNERRRGSETVVGSDIDNVRLRHFQRFIKHVAQMGAPDSVGDMHRLLSEQRALEADLRHETFALSGKTTAMMTRREQAMQHKQQPVAVKLRDRIAQEQPLVTRVVEKRRAKMLLDEAHTDAVGDIMQAESGLADHRERTRSRAFQDDRSDNLIEASTDPTQYIPEVKRSTDWLSNFTMPGDIEDPRVLNPFVLAADSSSPLASELRGREVGYWEAGDYAGVPQAHRGVAERLHTLFDFKRASDRVMLGLEEKSFADWRPSKTPEQKKLDLALSRRGNVSRRPISFFSRTNPDLRANKEWDDVLGAPYKEGTNILDQVGFYKKRVAWEKRKELAIRWGLEPKADETLAERDARRKHLDERLASCCLEGVANDMVAWGQQSRDEEKAQWFGKRHNRNRTSGRDDLFPGSVRPLNVMLKDNLTKVAASNHRQTTAAAAEYEFNKAWLQDTGNTLGARRRDPRIDYLSTAGIPTRNRAIDPCTSYAQVQDALWELRIYRGEPEPKPEDKTWIEDSTMINTMNTEWWMKLSDDTTAEFEATLKPEYRAPAKTATAVDTDDDLGWKSPDEIDKWKHTDGKDGLTTHREMTYPVDEVNEVRKSRWLAKTPWDRIAAYDLASKVMDPEEDARPMELGVSHYFNRNRLHYYRLPVQRLRSYGAELREAKELSEKMIPQDMSNKIKNYYAVARHSTVPFFSEHVTKNGPKFVNTPKVAFDNIGLHDDLEDYVRVNAHLTKWDAM